MRSFIARSGKNISDLIFTKFYAKAQKDMTFSSLLCFCLARVYGYRILLIIYLPSQTLIIAVVVVVIAVVVVAVVCAFS